MSSSTNELKVRNRSAGGAARADEAGTTQAKGRGRARADKAAAKAGVSTFERTPKLLAAPLKLAKDDGASAQAYLQDLKALGQEVDVLVEPGKWYRGTVLAEKSDATFELRMSDRGEYMSLGQSGTSVFIAPSRVKELRPVAARLVRPNRPEVMGEGEAQGVLRDLFWSKQVVTLELARGGPVEQFTGRVTESLADGTFGFTEGDGVGRVTVKNEQLRRVVAEPYAVTSPTCFTPEVDSGFLAFNHLAHAMNKVVKITLAGEDRREIVGIVKHPGLNGFSVLTLGDKPKLKQIDASKVVEIAPWQQTSAPAAAEPSAVAIQDAQAQRDLGRLQGSVWDAKS